MKNGYLKITLPLLLAMTSLVSGDASTQMGDSNVPMFNEYHNRISVFDPTHIVYERIKTDAFYVGVETWLAWAISSESSHTSGHALGEAELRMGYNYFYNGRDHVTPFLGVGVFRDFATEHRKSHVVVGGVEYTYHHHSLKPSIIYGTFGFLYDHEFNSVFNLGVNLKGIVGGASSNRRMGWGNPVGGVDVSLPMTFRFGYKRRWDIRLEPFDIYMHGSRHARNYFGGRSTVGFRF